MVKNPPPGPQGEWGVAAGGPPRRVAPGARQTTTGSWPRGVAARRRRGLRLAQGAPVCGAQGTVVSARASACGLPWGAAARYRRGTLCPGRGAGTGRRAQACAYTLHACAPCVRGKGAWHRARRVGGEQGTFVGACASPCCSPLCAAARHMPGTLHFQGALLAQGAGHRRMCMHQPWLLSPGRSFQP